MPVTCIEPELVRVPAGPFLMGTSDAQIDRLVQSLEAARQWRNKGRFGREQPQHEVVLPEYGIGKYPVTVGEYRPFVQRGGYRHKAFWTEAGWAWREAKGVTQPDCWLDVVGSSAMSLS